MKAERKEEKLNPFREFLDTLGVERGTPIEVQLKGRYSFKGKFLDVDLFGNIVLEREDGSRVLVRFQAVKFITVPKT
ncbi:MAG TPA: hypothetical protein ENG10_01185 [Candidatus Bathyarchaeota archaeon]|nr:hypothetical protein [Candidatus Bathyarchaeota archaeon]HEX68894.1 hypothetical protein [Candidatus Bathyarchaeota archaeon]